MSIPEILSSIGEKLASSATVKNVYGEPITVGNKTVVPVARIRYGFGGGGGREEDRQRSGGGGGGGVVAVPVGFIEITAEATRFMPLVDWRSLGSIAAICLGIGFLCGKGRKDDSA